MCWLVSRGHCDLKWDIHGGAFGVSVETAFIFSGVGVCFKLKFQAGLVVGVRWGMDTVVDVSISGR